MRGPDDHDMADAKAVNDAPDGGPDPAQEPPGSVPFRRLYGLARPHLAPLLGATALLLIISLAGLAVPKLAGEVVDAALDEADGAALWTVVGWLVALFAVLGTFAYLEGVLLGLAGARLLRDLRTQLFAHLIDLSAGFIERRRVGELLSRLGSDLMVVESSITQSIPYGIQALLRFVGTLVVLLVLQPRLTLVTLLVVPPVVLVAMFVGRRIERIAKEERDEAAKTAALAEEVFSGIRTVHASGASGRMKARLDGILETLMGLQVRGVHYRSAFGGAVSFAGFTAFALVLGYGGQLMLDGRLRPGELTAFLLYTFSIAMSVGQLGGLFTSYRQLQGSCARVFEILDEKNDVEDPAERTGGCAPFAPEHGRVDVEGLTFQYEGTSAPALDGLELRVEPGSTVALVGPSGSGKSTLFALLLRHFPAPPGSLSIDGRAIDEVSLEDLRRAVGVVSQEVFLMSGTVAENLRFGAPDAAEDELWAALEAAAAAGFVRELEKGLETEIGERGVRLSGGQRQRLAIARAFLEDPRVLLLDEATSALDPDAEAEVQRALHELFEGRTTLVIAHRLATARRADVIHVLDGGRIRASGTHAELVEASELYRRYWTLQSAAAEELRVDEDTSAAPQSSSAAPPASRHPKV